MKTILNLVLFAFVSAFTSPVLAAGKTALQRIVFFRARRRPRRAKEDLMATSTRQRYLVRWGLAAAFLALMHPAASAQDVPFAFLIKDGWKTLNTGVSTRPDQGLVSLHTTGTLHEVVGGQKGGVVGTADDMTVGVLVHIGQPSDPIPLVLDIPPYFPLVPFVNDAVFTRMGPDYFIGGAVCLGSGYGQAQGPLRVYTFCDDFGLGAEFNSALLVTHTEGSSYAVLACSHLYNPPSPGGVIDALVS